MLNSNSLVDGYFAAGITHRPEGAGITVGNHLAKSGTTRGNHSGNRRESLVRTLTPLGPPSVGGGLGVWVGQHHWRKLNMGELIFVVVIAAIGLYIGRRYANSVKAKQKNNRNRRNRDQ
jgi:hypothetical protein